MPGYLRHGLILMGLLWTCIARSAEMPVAFGDVLALEYRSPDRIISYGSHDSQQGALWLARRAGGPVPLIVLVHGGCWLSDYSAPHAYPLAASLARDGYAVWVPEYRRVGEEGGGWPGTPADVMRSLDVLTAENLPGVNRQQTVLMGHSAGGHLALWLASRESALFPRGLDFAGVIGLAAITDLDSYGRGTSSCQVVTPRLMGASPDEAPELYQQASPSSLMMQMPAVLLRGAEDGIVGPEQVSAMPAVESVELPGAGHFDWVHPETDAYKLLRDVIFEVLSVSMEGNALP